MHIRSAPRSRIAPPIRTASGVAVLVALAHGANDAYVAFLAPLLPRIMDKLGLSITLAATLAMTLSLAASLLQPVMGYLADRHGRHRFIVLGPLLAGVSLSLIGAAPNFFLLILLLALGGLGSAAFHPPGASMAARISEGSGSGARLSFFSFGGSVGYAAGPLIAVGLVALVGLEGLWMAMAPVIMLALVLSRILPADHSTGTAEPPPTPKRILARMRGPLGILFGISAASAFVQRVFLTMQPIAIASAGGSEAAGAVTLSVFLGGQALGTLTGGFLADRMNRQHVLVGLTFLGFPALVLALWLPAGTPAALLAAAVAGLFNMAILPPLVVIAQEILPTGAAVGSGIVMGLAWATGSIGVLGTGVLGDLFGPQTAALVCMPAIFIGTLLALHPALRAHRRAAPASAIE